MEILYSTRLTQGIKQANMIYNDNLNRLQRDYRGMVLYRKLLAENMVSLPYVAQTDLGITNENGEMRVNDQVLRITALPNLQSNSQTWNPVIVKNWQDEHNRAQRFNFSDIK
ncbi:MAG: type IV secretory system conjugative DNA transfer family protein [Legionellales bacterium]|nr:type IV secretory system conjugative DNA transfer family protein [Legionellales bacterium]